MSSSLTNWGANQFLAISFGLASQPTEFYLALCADEPGPDADGDSIALLEPDPAAGYARVSINADNTVWDNTDEGNYLTNLVEVDFPQPTDDWGSINYLALCDSLTSGEVYLYGEFDDAIGIVSGIPLILPIDSIYITLLDSQPSIAVV